MKDIINLLFETNAFKVCAENQPFWYTSGKIGPYFISTQFLYGSQEDADELLEFMNVQLETEEKIHIPQNIFKRVLKQYEENEIYRTVINDLIQLIKQEINIDEIDYISGGERRDWYFSNIVAYILKRPHITLYKDMASVISDYKFENSSADTNIKEGNVLHISDLVNQGSSYERYVEIIENLGAHIKWSATVVDRMQGGTEIIEKLGIHLISLFKIDNTLFEKALERGIITAEQQKMLNNFIENPDESMRQFLINNPEFLENELKKDKKTAERAQKCIDLDIYNLK